MTRPVSAACRRTYYLFPLPYSLKFARYRYRVETEAQPKAPLVKGGCLGLPRRGDSVAKATELIPYSLFPIP